MARLSEATRWRVSDEEWTERQTEALWADRGPRGRSFRKRFRTKARLRREVWSARMDARCWRDHPTETAIAWLERGHDVPADRLLRLLRRLRRLERAVAK